MNFARSNSSTLIKYYITTDVSFLCTPIMDDISLFALQQAYENSSDQTESQFVLHTSEQDLSPIPKTSEMCDRGSRSCV